MILVTQLSLQLSKTDLDKLYEYSENCLPNEAVALLFGRVIDEAVVVTQVETVKNESNYKETSFSVNPEEEYRLLIEAESRAETMVAIYHSHPVPPHPSPSDLRNMRLNPVIWLISSKSSGNWDSRAFILDNNNVVEVPVQIV